MSTILKLVTTFIPLATFGGHTYFRHALIAPRVFNSRVSGMVFSRVGLLLLWGLLAPVVTSSANLLLDFRDPTWKPHEPIKGRQGPT